jgi:phospholipid/cholesterol/gamma-HCH transport system substrate-binding protein
MAKTNPWKLGLFVLIGIAVAVGALVWLGLSRFSHESVIAVSYFDESVEGLSVGSEVRLRGVPVGSVTRMTGAPDLRHIQVEFELFIDVLRGLGAKRTKAEFEAGGLGRDDLRIQLTRNVLTGLALLQIDFYDPKEYPLPVYGFPTPKLTVYSVPTAMLGVQRDLAQAIERVPKLLDEAVVLIKRVDTTIQEIEFKKVSQKIQEVLTSADESIKKIDADKVREDLRSPIKKLEDTLDEIRLAASEVRESNGSVQKATAEYEALGHTLRIQVAEADLPGTTQSLRETLDSLRRLAVLLERDPGSLIHGKTTPPMPSPSGRN